MARSAPRLSLIISMFGAIVLLCAAMVVLMRYGEIKIKERDEKKPAAGSKKSEPSGPYAEVIKNLDARLYQVTQGTEDDLPSMGVNWNRTASGLYLDVVSGEVLFSSRDKLPSLEGRTEFSRPVDEALLVLEPEMVDGEARVRVKSKKAGTRLGWKKKDAENKERYFLNSSALRFVAEEDLEKEKLGEFKKLAGPPTVTPPPPAEDP